MRYVGLSGGDERTSGEDYSSHTARPGKRSNDTAKRAKRRSHHSQSPSHYVLQTNQRESPPRDPASIYHVRDGLFKNVFASSFLFLFVYLFYMFLSFFFVALSLSLSLRTLKYRTFICGLFQSTMTTLKKTWKHDSNNWHWCNSVCEAIFKK